MSQTWPCSPMVRLPGTFDEDAFNSMFLDTSAVMDIYSIDKTCQTEDWELQARDSNIAYEGRKCPVDTETELSIELEDANITQYENQSQRATSSASDRSSDASSGISDDSGFTMHDYDSLTDLEAHQPFSQARLNYPLPSDILYEQQKLHDPSNENLLSKHLDSLEQLTSSVELETAKEPEAPRTHEDNEAALSESSEQIILEMPGETEEVEEYEQATVYEPPYKEELTGAYTIYQLLHCAELPDAVIVIRQNQQIPATEALHEDEEPETEVCGILVCLSSLQQTSQTLYSCLWPVASHAVHASTDMIQPYLKYPIFYLDESYSPELFIVFDILHSHNPNELIPGQLLTESLMNILELCEKYDCLNAIDRQTLISVLLTIDKDPEADSWGSNIEQWIRIGWALRSFKTGYDIYKKKLSDLILGASKLDKNGAYCVLERNRDMNVCKKGIVRFDRLPRRAQEQWLCYRKKIFETIKAYLKRFIGTLEEMYHAERYCCGDRYCSLEARSLLLGLLESTGMQAILNGGSSVLGSSVMSALVLLCQIGKDMEIHMVPPKHFDRDEDAEAPLTQGKHRPKYRETQAKMEQRERKRGTIKKKCRIVDEMLFIVQEVAREVCDLEDDIRDARLPRADLDVRLAKVDKLILYDS